MINTINHNIYLDLGLATSVAPRIRVKQQDADSHNFIFHITEIGEAYDLTGLTAKVYFSKGDGNLVVQDCVLDDAEGGILSVLLADQCLTYPGFVNTELTIYGTEGELLTSESFLYRVLDLDRNETATESTSSGNLNENYMTYVDSELQTMQSYIEGIDQKYDDEIGDIDNKLNHIAVDIKLFGAVGDGVTDDTLAIQTAIDTLNGKSGTVLFPFPSSFYLISDTLLIDSNIEMFGKGRAKIIIKTNATKPIVKSRYAGTLRLSDVVIKNMQFDGDNKATIGLELTDASNLTLDNVFVTKCTKEGIKISTDTSFSGYLTFINTRSTYNKTGLSVGTINDANALMFIGGGYNRNTENGIYIKAGSSVSLLNVECSNNTITGFKIGTTRTSFISCYQEGNGVDFHILPSGDIINISCSRYSNNPPANIKNEGNNVTIDSYGVPTKLSRYSNINLIQNGSFKQWSSEAYPPFIPFVIETGFSELIKTKTTENHLQCTTTRVGQLLKLNLTSLLPFLKNEKITCGMFWKGKSTNSGKSKRIKLFTNIGDLEYKSYNQGGILDKFENEQVAVSNAVIPPEATTLELRFELSNVSDTLSIGDIIIITGFFLSIGNQIAGSSINAVTELGGVMNKPLYAMDSIVLKDSSTGSLYKLVVTSGVLSIAATT